MSTVPLPPGTPGRVPQALASRMEALATLPLFFKLHGARCVVVGGSDGAAWKAELLAAAGARVDVYATAPAAVMAELGEHLPDSIILHGRAWLPADLAQAALAIGDCADAHEARAFQAAAKRAGVPVNVIDKPEFCDFQFGAIVNRSPLVVGISTDGAAPVFGQALRARIETLLPEGFRRWAQAAQDWRPFVQALKLDFRARRNVWEAFTRMALAAPGRAPDDSDRQALLEAARHGAAQAGKRGSVALVGAGPGDPELLTLKAVRLLQSADVVLYDDLVSPRVVDMARREAQRIAVGKRGYKPSCTQEEITGMLVQLAQAGKHVVRLKGGDPMIFGRAGEEIAALQRAGVPVEIVPGVTAASGAAAALQVSLTHRDHARRLQLITAHARDGKLPADLDWRALCDPAATSIVYMGVKTLPLLVARLLAEGIDPATPAAVVERATWADERRFFAPLAELPGVIARAAPKGPCLVMIGAVLGEYKSPAETLAPAFADG